jgi:hypothetical protein
MWSYRIARRMGSGQLGDEATLRRRAGHRSVTLDIWLPYWITTVFFFAVVLLLRVRVLEPPATP